MSAQKYNPWLNSISKTVGDSPCDNSRDRHADPEAYRLQRCLQVRALQDEGLVSDSPYSGRVGRHRALPIFSEPVNFVGKLHSAWAHYCFKHRIALINRKSLVGVGDAHRQDLTERRLDQPTARMCSPYVQSV